MTAEGFSHGVFFYEDPDDFLATSAPFLRGAIDGDEPALAAVSPRNIELLEGELGADAARVCFADMRELGLNPARMIPFWRRFLDEHGGTDRPLRGIGEPVWPGRSSEEIDECQRHESLLNFAFEESPAWSLICPYDSAHLDDGVLQAAADSHPYIAEEGGAGLNSAWFDAGASPFEGTLPEHPREAETLFFDLQGLAAVRDLVSRRARAAGMATTRREDLVLAASELAANSVSHGGGSGSVAVWSEGDRLLVETEDLGLIGTTLAGSVRPEVTQVGGRGLWLANQLCDLVQIRSGAEGTRVRLHMALS
jgi:anti-sigma regulatory factor (Ser/Thr protein kinase)